jgi:hypothetical protein
MGVGPFHRRQDCGGTADHLLGGIAEQHLRCLVSGRNNAVERSFYGSPPCKYPSTWPDDALETDGA